MTEVYIPSFEVGDRIEVYYLMTLNICPGVVLEKLPKDKLYKTHGLPYRVKLDYSPIARKKDHEAIVYAKHMHRARAGR